MAIPFQPKPRTVVYCDFAGFVAPEIIKRRPVIVMHAHKRNSKLMRSGRRRADGKREYLIPRIGAEQFEAVRKGVVSGLGLTSLLSGSSIPTVPARGFRDSDKAELDLESDDKLPGP